MELSDCIMGRRSIRKYEDASVPMKLIEDVIEAGTYAPSACNFQAWKFIVVTDESLISAISDAGSPVIKRAKQGIVVTYRNDIKATGRNQKDWVQSAAAAVQNMLLTAYSKGLAACWICDLRDVARIKGLLGIPENYDVICYVTIGYPKKSDENSIEEKLFHYHSLEAFAEHKRRYTREQVICRNAFEKVEGDSTEFNYPKAQREK